VAQCYVEYHQSRTTGTATDPNRRVDHGRPSQFVFTLLHSPPSHFTLLMRAGVMCPDQVSSWSKTVTGAAVTVCSQVFVFGWPRGFGRRTICDVDRPFSSTSRCRPDLWSRRGRGIRRVFSGEFMICKAGGYLRSAPIGWACRIDCSRGWLADPRCRPSIFDRRVVFPLASARRSTAFKTWQPAREARRVW